MQQQTYVLFHFWWVAMFLYTCAFLHTLHHWVISLWWVSNRRPSSYCRTTSLTRHLIAVLGVLFHCHDKRLMYSFFNLDLHPRFFFQFLTGREGLGFCVIAGGNFPSAQQYETWDFPSSIWPAVKGMSILRDGNKNLNSFGWSLTFNNNFFCWDFFKCKIVLFLLRFFFWVQ